MIQSVSYSLCSVCLSSGKDKASQPATKSNDSDKYGSVPAQSSSLPSDNYEDDFDDFDPRGTSTKSK